MDSVTAITAAGAVLALVATVLATRMQIRAATQQNLETLWASILEMTATYPHLCDISVTEGYLRRLTWDQRLQYDAICLQAWSLIHEAHLRRFSRAPRLRLALKWMVSFHSTWLDHNKHLFWSRAFWKSVQREQRQEPTILRHRPVRGTDSLTDPDQISERYFEVILSPLDPVIPPGVLDFEISTALDALPGPSIVLDFSSGPGMLFAREEVARRLHRHWYVAMDQSYHSCLATRARSGGPIMQGSLAGAPLRAGSIDLAIGLGALLNGSREENVRRFREISRLLAPNGLAILVLPAFEAISHLGSLRLGSREGLGRRSSAGARYHESILRLKAPRSEDASYTDDGCTREYFHSKETIERELPQSGLDIVKIERVTYPWELCRRFDYGYFPNQPPVWDWLVVCSQRGSNQRALTWDTSPV